jgi:hypothetical protein
MLKKNSSQEKKNKKIEWAVFVGWLWLNEWQWFDGSGIIRSGSSSRFEWWLLQYRGRRIEGAGGDFMKC